jgi:ureidoacrylate peracid hydrolase
MPEMLTSLEAILQPARCALLVVDLQNDFVHPDGWGARHNPSSPLLRHVIPVANRLIAAGRGAGVLVCYLTMEHGPGLDAPNYRARYAARGMDADILCAEGGWGAQLDAEVLPPERGDVRIVRHSYDGFAGTPLDARLRAGGREAVVAAGVVTNLCVQTTVQHAFALGYYVVVAEDGTAATSEAVQAMTLDNFRQFFGAVVPGDAIVRHWRR